MFLATLFLASSNALAAYAFQSYQLGSLKPPTRVSLAAEATKTQYFDQLIDHSNPSLGTFKQRYFFDDSVWTGQGAPIVLSNPGEQSADGFDSFLSASDILQGALIQNLGAAGIVLERESSAATCFRGTYCMTLDRYWGSSSPYDQLTTDNMKYLTVDQAIEDTKVSEYCPYYIPAASDGQS